MLDMMWEVPSGLLVDLEKYYGVRGFLTTEAQVVDALCVRGGSPALQPGLGRGRPPLRLVWPLEPHISWAASESGNSIPSPPRSDSDVNPKVFSPGQRA